ncbi:MAG: hypothetical protein AAB408_02370 [Patescibacteria group bacterium]
MTPNKSFTREIVISLLLLAFIILFCNPLNILMTPVMLMWVTACFIACFALFAAFVWQERARDEREAVNSMAAGRTAFLTGVGVLVIGIVYQARSHEIDPWLLLALGMMVAAKMASVLYEYFRS